MANTVLFLGIQEDEEREEDKGVQHRDPQKNQSVGKKCLKNCNMEAKILLPQNHYPGKGLNKMYVLVSWQSNAKYSSIFCVNGFLWDYAWRWGIFWTEWQTAQGRVKNKCIEMLRIWGI